MASSEPLFSVTVIIPVRVVTPELHETLSALRRLSPPPEILILPDVLPTPPLAGVHTIPTGPATPGDKRNRALVYAHGDILAFLDDDAYPRADWLGTALRHFRRPAVSAVGGPGLTPLRDSLWAQVSGAVYTSWLGSGPVRMRSLPVGRVRRVRDWPTANLFVRRSMFERAGGFPLDYWPGEDTKLCLDILRAGGEILYDPDVVVYHHRATTPLKHLRQVGRYGLHRGHFTRAFPETSLRLAYMLPSVAVLVSALFALFVLLVPRTRRPLGIAALALLWVTLLFGLREAWRSRRWAVAFFFPFLLSATHVTYGVGYLRGLLAPSLKGYTRLRR